jgi:hypothetical protein
MDDLIRRIGLAKVIIDNGMCRVGPQLDAASAVDQQLVRGAGRAIQLSDAVVALCRQGHANEALPIVRQLCETAASLCWLAAALDAGARSSGARAEELAREWEGSKWSMLWPEERLLRRAREGGLAEDAHAVLGLCREFVQGGPLTLPWAHRFGWGRLECLLPRTVLGRAASIMAHVLQALELRWPGGFPGAEKICQR